MRLGHFQILDHLHELKQAVNKDPMGWCRIRVGDHKEEGWFYPALRSGNALRALQWLEDNGYGEHFIFLMGKFHDRDAKVLGIPECLGEHGHLDALQWWKSHGHEWDEGTIMMAAVEGHDEVMKWLAENGCPFTEMTHLAAEVSGSDDCLTVSRNHKMENLPYPRLHDWGDDDENSVRALRRFLRMDCYRTFTECFARGRRSQSQTSRTGDDEVVVMDDEIIVVEETLTEFVSGAWEQEWWYGDLPDVRLVKEEEWKDFKKRWNRCALRCFIHVIREHRTACI